jgi:hypothetical protein
MWCLGSVKTFSGKGILVEGDTITFETDSPVISKLIWLELDENPSDAYVEKRPLDGQLGTGTGPNIAARNRSIDEHDRRHHVDRHVEIPINRVIFFEFVRLVFDIGAVFENELEVGRRAFLDKIDRDIYELPLSRLSKSLGPTYPSSEYICESSGQHTAPRKLWVQD